MRAHAITMLKQPLGFARKRSEEAQQQAVCMCLFKSIIYI